MKIRRFFAFIIPVIALAIGMRVLQMRRPDVWKPNASHLFLSADGSRLVALGNGSPRQRLRVWNITERRAMNVQFPSDKNHIFQKVLAVSPDGRAAAFIALVTGPKPSIWLEEWDITRVPVRQLWRMPSGFETVATFADGHLKTLQNSAVKTYDARGKLVSNVQLAGCEPNKVFFEAALSMDGSILVDGMNLILYDARSGQVLRRLQRRRPYTDTDLDDFSFSPDYRFLMADDTSGRSPRKVLWNVKSGRIEKQKTPLDGFWAAQGHGWVQRDGRVEDVVTRQKSATIPLPVSGASVTNIQTSLDGRVVVVQRSDGNVWIQNPHPF